VLTSVLGINNKASMFELPLNKGYHGAQYTISQTSQVWLEHKTYQNDEGFVAEWDYVEQLFDDQTINAMHDGYCQLIRWVAEHDCETLSFPQLKPPGEQAAAVMRWNDTQGATSVQTLHGLFLSCLEQSQTAKRIAVIETEGERHYSYARLANDSSAVGQALLHHTQGEKESVVGILLEKGYAQVVAMLGIMRSGEAYLPLHIDLPWERICDILLQARCDTLLLSAQQHHHLSRELEALPPDITILVLDELLARAPEKTSEDVVWPAVNATDLAYIIFTSGSTGKTKGVAILVN